jgi:hypothetical protein
MTLDLVSQAEAAELLGVSVDAVKRFRSTGRLAYSKLASGAIRIRRQHALILRDRLAEPRPTPAMTSDAAELPVGFLRPVIRRAA